MKILHFPTIFLQFNFQCLLWLLKRQNILFFLPFIGGNFSLCVVKMIFHLLNFKSAMFRKKNDWTKFVNALCVRSRQVFTKKDISSLKIGMPVTVHLKVHSQCTESMFIIAFSGEHRADIWLHNFAVINLDLWGLQLSSFISFSSGTLC